MTEFHFKIVLGLYLLIVIGSFFVPHSRNKVTSDETNKFEWLNKLEKLNRYATAAMVFSVLAAGAAGFIGMFLLRPWGAYMFFTAVVIRIVGDFTLFQEASKKGLEGAFSKSMLLAELAIAILIFYGPANVLFFA